MFRTVVDVREAVQGFMVRYNNQWQVSKNALRAPQRIRRAWQKNGKPHKQNWCL